MTTEAAQTETPTNENAQSNNPFAGLADDANAESANQQPGGANPFAQPGDQGSGETSGAGNGEGEGGGEGKETGGGAGEGETGGAEASATNQGTGDDQGKTSALSINSLAEQLGVEQDQLLDVTVTGKIDGEPVERSIRDLLAVDQTLQAAENRLEESREVLKNANEEASQQKEALTDHVKQQAGIAAALVKLAENLFGAEVSDADLQALKDKDTEQYLLVKDQLETRARQINEVKTKVGTALKAALDQGNTISPETRTEEREKLLKAMPELKADGALDQLADYIIDEAGFTVEEMQAQPDNRLYQMAEKARRYDALQAKGGAARKRQRDKDQTLTNSKTDAKSSDKKDWKDVNRANLLYS